MSDKTLTFSVSDLVKQYTAKDFVPSKPEPREGFYEFRVKSASLGQAKKGYLQVTVLAEALDSDGKSMFSKFVNLALPVAFKGIAPGEWANGILSSFVAAVHPELLSYDEVTEDAATGKKVYLKNGAVVSKEEFKAAQEKLAQHVKDWLDTLLDPATAEQAANDFVGRTFFGRVETKNEYTNVSKIIGRKPAKEAVIYSASDAYSRQSA